MSPQSNGKPAIGQWSTSKKDVTSISYKLEPAIWSRYGSADTLFWQVSVDNNMDVQYQRSTQQTKTACLCQAIIWIMATMLHDSVVVIVCTRPWAIPLRLAGRRSSAIMVCEHQETNQTLIIKYIPECLYFIHLKMLHVLGLREHHTLKWTKKFV